MVVGGFVIVCVLTGVIATERCPLQELKDTVITCTNGIYGQLYFPTGLDVKVGTECAISDGISSSTVRCNGPNWEHVKAIESADSFFLEQTQLHSRYKRGFLSDLFEGIFCVLTLFSCLWAGRAGPPPDRTAPVFKYCPGPVITAYPGPFQTWAQVTWKEPTAHDTVDGYISPQLIKGRPSGRHFPGDKTTQVRYVAKDRSGNVNYCNFVIDVKVIRCPAPQKVQNGYFSCFPTTEFLLGGHCRFGCYDGYELVGQSVLTCQANRSWTGQQPYCKDIECTTLPSVSGAGMPSCTNRNKFNSICTYQCQSGFDMPPNVSKALVCTSQKKWRAFGKPSCIDVASPRFQRCPSVQIFGTDPGHNTSIVFWDSPVVVDNSDDGNIRIQADLTQESPAPGDKLVVGTYTIEYRAQDKQGNTALPCKFNVIVRDIRCPQLYPTPYQEFSCPSGSRSQSVCSISCRENRVLDPPTNEVQCEQQSGQLFGLWKWRNGRQPVCKTTNFCDPLPTPVNGAVVCDNWFQGKYCQVQCRNGTRMVGGLPRELFVCSRAATWSKEPDSIYPCQIERRPQPHVGIDAVFFFDGECSSPIAKEKIAQNFIDKLVTTGFGREICENYKDKCRPNNVQISCGETLRVRLKADDHNVTMTIHFELPVRISEDMFAENQLLIYKLYDSVKVAIRNITTEMLGNQSSLLKITNNGIQVTCPEGSIKSETKLSCLDCPEGTYFNRESVECKPCTKGFYQDQTGSTACIKCPYTTTTRGLGSVSPRDCEDACEPGSYSSDGIFPCTPCKTGTYQSSYGQIKCRACSGSKTTFADSVRSSSECQEFDILFPKSSTTSSAVLTFPAEIVRDFSISFWVQMNAPGSPYPSVEFYNADDVRVWTIDRLQKIVHSGSLTVVDHQIRDRRWHHVMIESRGCFADVYINGNLLTGSKLSGNCSDIEISRITFNAERGFEGGLSQLNVWDQGTGPVSFSRCFSNETGNLLKWQDFGDSTLADGYIQIPSQCDDFDNCISNPCKNNGPCIDALGGYHCACADGFTGSRCEVNIDDCKANICMHGSTCLDDVQIYKCLCSTGLTGTYCEIQVVDGQWSGWGNWSECTTSCGDGKQSRKRLCINPIPENGGKDCEGPDIESHDCNMRACPVCPVVAAPVNGSFECTNTTDFISCTLICDEGYDLDIEPLPLYFCGWNTSYEWNFQNDKNPGGRTPNCMAIEHPEQMTVHYSAQYKDLLCMSPMMGHATNESIRKRVSSVVNELVCIKNQTCELNNLVVTNCDGSLRERRQAETAGFTMTITSQPSNSIFFASGNTSDLFDLQEAFHQFQIAADNGNLTTEVLGDEYELVKNSTFVSGDVTCAVGSTRVNFYCIPCGPGTFHYEDYCRPCDVGTYQHIIGSSTCNPCPEGTSTVGMLSTTVAECSVNVFSNVDTVKVTTIVLGCCSAFVLLGASICAYRRYRLRKERVIEPMFVDLGIQAPMGPSNKHYIISTQSDNGGLMTDLYVIEQHDDNSSF